MAEKLLYLQNGVYKRKEISNGIMTYNNNSFSSVAPTKNGSFYIKLDDTGVSFEEKEAALQTVNPSDLNYSHITTPHIIYVNNNNFNTLTLPSQQGNYMLVNDSNNTPSFSKLSVTPADMGINKTDTGSALMMIAGDNSIKYISIIKNNWVNALFYNNNEKRWIASQITLYQQCGWEGTITGFGLPLIKGDKSNTYITLTENLSGDYLFAYSGNSTPTLKKIDTKLLELRGEGLIMNNGQNFTTLKAKTNGNYYLKYTNGIPSLEAVPASVAKISSKLIFTAASTQLTNELNTSAISCEGTNNFTVGKTFLVTYEFDLYTSDIEGIIAGFKTVPILKINYETTQLGEVCLGNPNNYIHVSGSSIITTTTTAINLTFLLENDQVASYSFANNIKVNLAEI